MARKLLGLIIVVAAAGLMWPGMASAGPLTIGTNYVLGYDGPGSGTNNGGPFRVTSLDGKWSYNTFCVERNEYFNPEQQYTLGDPSLTKTIVKGGLDGVTTLRAGTDWLFAQWANKTAVWSGWYAGLSGTQAQKDATVNVALQLAIWFLEGELPTGDAMLTVYNGNALANSMVTAAPTSGDFGTVVLNWKTGSTDAQSFLYRVPEPSLILLLGIALCFLSVALLRKA